MRVAFAGTAPLAAAVLGGLASGPCRVVCVITTPDKPRGRHGTPQPSPTKVAAEELGLPVLQPERPDDEAALAALMGFTPEVLVVCAYGRIIRAPLLRALPVIVVHPSAVPCWRGAAPVVRALMAGETELGVATLRMTEGVDEGPVGDLRWVHVPPEADAGRAYELLAPAAAASVQATLHAMADGTIVWREQEGEPTYATKIEAGDREIDWRWPARAIVDQVRALSPHVGAVTVLDGKRVLVWRARAAAELPAERKGRLFMPAAEGFVELLEVQPEGRRRMTAGEFLRGIGRALAQP
jgi:methionyl-tRNA formyltransferase